jgi:hypothetical protein
MRKYRCLPAILFLAFFHSTLFCTSEVKAGAEENRTALQMLLKALDKNDRTAVAHLIRYPFGRELPLSTLNNSVQFLKHYDEYFDADSARFLSVASGELIDRNGELGTSRGEIWFRGGKIITINAKTAAYDAALADAKKQDNLAVHSTLRGYDRILLDCRTNKLHIRIQQHGKDFKYFSWEKSSSISTKPALALAGTETIEGSARNATYTFKKNGTTYEVSIDSVCSSDYADPINGRCRPEIVMSKDDNEIQKDFCD